MSTHHRYSMPFGAEVMTDGGVRFRLWAPAQRKVALLLESAGIETPMEDVGGGWFETTVRDASARPGGFYRYRLGDGSPIPDPASRFQPRDVHGPSEIVDGASYAWRHDDWRGRPWEETVLYELHVGGFSPDGTFNGARRLLDHLARIGVTAVELMPLSDFEGARNWGYDGVFPFAPDSSYGRAETLKRLIDEAHARELMVFLDVVYNHFGPSGNYLNQYAPTFFTARHQTPWGDALNFDDEGSATVRSFFVHNALYWLEEFRFDGLRLDAVHAIKDDSPVGILDEIARAVRERIPAERHVHLVVENDDNCAHLLDRAANGAPCLYNAQWNDDFHHCAHVLLTGEGSGYYADYAEAPVVRFGRVLAEGFAYQGEPSPHREGGRRGEPSFHLPPTAFVSFLQNHDQIGNRAFGDRLAALAPAGALDAMQAILLLSPEIPMLFMGEEWGTCRPFLFFCDFHDELATAVREGRRREFSRFPQFQNVRDQIPDPNALETYEHSRLDWNELDAPGARDRIDRVRSLVALRRTRIVPLLSGPTDNRAQYEHGPGGTLAVSWTLARGSRLHLLANLANEPAAPLERSVRGEPLHAVGWGRAIAKDARVASLPPWAVIFSIEDGDGKP